MVTQNAISTYAIDPTHSTAEFAVKHLMISTVKGRFRDLDGTIRLDEGAPQSSYVEAAIRTASIDTGLEPRDNHLRSASFFDVETFPAMTFRSTSVERVDDERWRVLGDLKIRDVTRPVVLETELEGRGTDPWGRERIGFSATTRLNRQDFGLTYNEVLETGGLAIGNDVRVSLHIQAVRQDADG